MQKHRSVGFLLMCFPDVFQTGWFTLCASVCVIVSDTLQSWLRALKKDFEMPTQRPEWRLASKTDIPKNTLCGEKNGGKFLTTLFFLYESPRFFTFAPSTPLHKPTFILPRTFLFLSSSLPLFSSALLSLSGLTGVWGTIFQQKLKLFTTP